MRIVFIDNSPAEFSTVEQELVDLGFKNVLKVTSHIEALKVIQTSLPALIIVDTVLESQKIWIDFLEQVHDTVPAIVVTDSGEETFYQSINDKRNIAYLIKPIHKLTLGATIKILTNEAISEKSIYLNGNHNIRTKLLLNDIYFFAVDGNYSFAYTRTAKFVAKYSLDLFIS